MDHNYWLDDTPIKATLEEKKKIFEEYELWIFRETCKRLNLQQETTFDRNLLFESLAIHTRLLVDFFYNERNIKYPNDLLAQDLLQNDKNWKEIRLPLTQTLQEGRYKADKQLAHLSLWRIKLEKDGKKSWDWLKISDDMEKIIKEFKK